MKTRALAFGLFIVTMTMSGCMGDGPEVAADVKLMEELPEGGAPSGGLLSMEGNWCEADAGSDRSVFVRGEALVIGTHVSIGETNSDEERRTARLEVEWGESRQNSARPPDEQVEQVFPDTRSSDDRWEGWLVALWSADMFTGATYHATVRVQLDWEEREWDTENDFVQRCSDSDTVEFNVQVP